LKFFDFHLRGKNLEADHTLIKEALRLGYAGVSLFYLEKDYKLALKYLDRIRADINLNNYSLNHSSGNITDFQIIAGLKLKPKNPLDLQKKIRNLPKTDILMVQGGDLKINRAACENIKVDILSRPYYKRRDSGINHVLAKEAFKNNVSIEISLNDLLRSKNSLRAKIISYFHDIIKLHRKFNFPLLISSGAASFYDLRTPRDLIALFKCLNMNEDEIITSISHLPRSILDNSLQRKNTIVSGVKVIP